MQEVYRLQKLQELLPTWNVRSCLIENPLDVFYLTGLKFSSATLIAGEKQHALFVDGRYLAFAQKESPVPTFPLSNLSDKTFTSPIGFDTTSTTVERFEALKKLFPHLQGIAKPLRNLRAVKDKEEIDQLEKSSRLLWKGFLHIQNKLEIGITEQEVAYLFEKFCRENGAQRLGFEPIIAFGHNTAYPHHRASNTPLTQDSLVLCDLGVVVDHYHSDMTRTFFFGNPSQQARLLCDTVRNAHRSALSLCKSGVSVEDVSRAAYQVIEKAGLEKYITHSLGHGIGLEIHEFPRICEKEQTLLQEGMVITIEPGLYSPEIGGARHEDTIAITQNGYKNFYEA